MVLFLELNAKNHGVRTLSAFPGLGVMIAMMSTVLDMVGKGVEANLYVCIDGAESGMIVSKYD